MTSKRNGHKWLFEEEGLYARSRCISRISHAARRFSDSVWLYFVLTTRLAKVIGQMYRLFQWHLNIFVTLVENDFSAACMLVLSGMVVLRQNCDISSARLLPFLDRRILYIVNLERHVDPHVLHTL